MAWIDPALWKDEELSSIFRLIDHFQHTLESANRDRSKLKYEWKELKHTVKFYYRGVPATLLWPRIFQYRKAQFRNICISVELVLVFGASNSVMEAGFSQLTSMLSDRRPSLKHETMENLMIIKANHKSFS